MKSFSQFLVFLGLVFFIIRIMTPNHPHIGETQTTKEVMKFIKQSYEQNSLNISLEYQGVTPIEYIKASENYIYNLKKCKNNKECLITKYDEFMNDWSSEISRKYTRAYYMLEKFGVIGEQINKSLGFMY